MVKRLPSFIFTLFLVSASIPFAAFSHVAHAAQAETLAYVTIEGGTEGAAGDWEREGGTSENYLILHPRTGVHLTISNNSASQYPQAAPVSLKFTDAGENSSVTLDGYKAENYSSAEQTNNTPLIDIAPTAGNPTFNLSIKGDCRLSNHVEGYDIPVIHKGDDASILNITADPSGPSSSLLCDSDASLAAAIGGYGVRGSTPAESAKNIFISGLNNFTAVSHSLSAAIIGGGGAPVPLTAATTFAGGSLDTFSLSSCNIVQISRHELPATGAEYGAALGGGGGRTGGDASNITVEGNADVTLTNATRSTFGAGIGGGGGWLKGGDLNSATFSDNVNVSVRCASTGDGWAAGIGGGGAQTGAPGEGQGGSASAITFKTTDSLVSPSEYDLACAETTAKGAAVGGGFGATKGGDLTVCKIESPNSGLLMMHVYASTDISNRKALGAAWGGGGSFTQGGSCYNFTLDGGTVFCACKKTSSYSFGADVGGGGTEVNNKANAGSCQGFRLKSGRLITMEEGNHDTNLPAGASVGSGYAEGNSSASNESSNNMLNGEQAFLYAMSNTKLNTALQGFDTGDEGEYGFLNGLCVVHDCATETTTGTVYGSYTYENLGVPLLKDCDVNVPEGATFLIKNDLTKPLQIKSLTNLGTTAVASGMSVLVLGPFTNEGTVNIQGSLALEGVTYNNGTMSVTNSHALEVSNAFHNTDTGVLVNPENITCTGKGYVDTKIGFTVDAGPFDGLQKTDKTGQKAFLPQWMQVQINVNKSSRENKSADGDDDTKVQYNTVLYMTPDGIKPYGYSLRRFPSGPYVDLKSFDYWTYVPAGQTEPVRLTLETPVMPNLHGIDELTPNYAPANWVNINPVSFEHGSFEDVPERVLGDAYLYFHAYADEGYRLSLPYIETEDGEIYEAEQDPTDPSYYAIRVPNFPTAPVEVELKCSAELIPPTPDPSGDTGSDTTAAADAGLLPLTGAGFAAFGTPILGGLVLLASALARLVKRQRF